nr:MAG TPA: hypothetical protein [Caudoviricetes sp.]DAZ22301.1 MAG TPA: hypothetical protein [Caudoviricetes sp.]
MLRWTSNWRRQVPSIPAWAMISSVPGRKPPKPRANCKN